LAEAPGVPQCNPWRFNSLQIRFPFGISFAKGEVTAAGPGSVGRRWPTTPLTHLNGTATTYAHPVRDGFCPAVRGLSG